MQLKSEQNYDYFARAMSDGARTLLGWASESSRQQPKCRSIQLLGLSGEKELKARTIEALQRTLEGAGVEFIDENGGGPGVRLKKSIKGKGRK